MPSPLLCSCRSLSSIVGASLLTLLTAVCPGAERKALSSEPGGASGRAPDAGVAQTALDLRKPMALAARAIARRLDPAKEHRPWFMLRGRGGIPVAVEHASWDFGDMTGRYLEGLILARRMGISTPEFSLAEHRLQRYLLKLIGPDGLIHDADSGAVDHSFSQGSALYGLVAWFEDSEDPAVRKATERLIAGLAARALRRGDRLVDLTVKLPESSGSHLAGYQIYPAVRFYELTGYPPALELAEGLTRWAMDDPTLGRDGAITKPLSWEGHIHSWLDTLAGCVRTARNSSRLDRQQVVARSRAVYDWVQRTNATSFGWIATYPTGGSCETCAISSAMRLALELAASGHPEYRDDVERFVRNQVVEAQFRDIAAYRGGPQPPTPLLIGCFDSQSMPNCHLGTRGGEDVGTVEGCCLNGGMRAIALAYGNIVDSGPAGTTIHFALSTDGPAAKVIGYQPFEGRVDIIPRSVGFVRVRLPRWARRDSVTVSIDDRPVKWTVENGYVAVQSVPARSRVTVRFPLRELDEDVSAGGRKYHVRWKGDTVVAVSPSEGREPTYRRLSPLPQGEGQGVRAIVSPRNVIPEFRRGSPDPAVVSVPDTYYLQDAARLASLSMVARVDARRGGQPFFRILPFANPPYAEHGKWDDGDTTGRYVEGLILARRTTGAGMDPRESMLRGYLASLFDPTDGLCYTRAAPWTPRRACMFSQSSAMLGLLAWQRETGSAEARRLLDRQVDGLMRIAVDRGDYAYFPKYEYDGKAFVDDPQGKDAPSWYGGRLILPLVEYWQLSGRADVQLFLEKLVRYSTEVSKGIGTDGEVRGNGWWGHLHGTMDMAAGIAEFGRLTGRDELVAWANRVYDWIGRTHTTRYGWVADAVGSRNCESCAIASRIRLGLALYRAGKTDPFGEIDRHLRNQLLESQFRDLSFMAAPAPQTPRTDRLAYAGVDAMIRGTFQCWATANDLIGSDEIEGCGAAGGVQGLALASGSQYEWRGAAEGQELRVHLLMNRRIRAPVDGPLTTGTPVAAELWSNLPREGRVVLLAHRTLPQLALRLPDGVALDKVQVRRHVPEGGTPLSEAKGVVDGQYAIVRQLGVGERVELVFPLAEYEALESAQGTTYKVRWKGSAVVSIEPKGTKVPLYADRSQSLREATPLSAPRYP